VFENAGNHAGLLRATAMNSRYLFSGLLECGICGANLQVVSGHGRNHDHQTYGCPMNFHRGDSICTNRVRIRRDVLERELLAGLQADVLREDVANYVVDRFESELVKELENVGGEMDRMKRRKAELESEIARLTAGLASGIHSPAVMAEIAKREREIAEFADRLLSSNSASIRSRVKRLRETAVDRIRDLRHCLNTDTTLARAHLAKHIERIVMQPGERTYVASASWNLVGAQMECAEGQNRTAYAGLFRAALYR
jgi:hypothetical protein